METRFSSVMLFITFILMAFIAPIQTWAAWSNNPTINTAIATGSDYKSPPQIASDGNGGAIITWEAYSYSTSRYSVYAQRIDADGNLRWGANGITICTGTGSTPAYPQIVSDVSEGSTIGAIITWEDYRNGNADIYAQKVDADGNVKWTANGVAISAATGAQSQPRIVSDYGGGAIITWLDTRNGSFMHIYAQGVDADGAARWTANGVAICTATNGRSALQITTDGSGGAIITWLDTRNGRYDIYAQRIDDSGSVKWVKDGAKLTYDQNSFNQSNPAIVANMTGVIITWQDDRTAVGSVVAQKLGINGNYPWGWNGVVVYTGTGGYYPAIADDGSEGAIVTWLDNRNTNYKIYAQRLAANGTAQWTANGVAVCNAATVSNLYPLQITGDGGGGAIIAWQDSRNGNADIYAQRLAANGAIQWAANGVAVSTAADNQISPRLVSDGDGGAIFTWGDARASSFIYDIYAQKVISNGTLPIPFQLNLNLGNGWNFVSFPNVAPSTDVATVLSGVSSNVQIVWGYDNQNKVWKRWKPISANNALVGIDSDKGYWIYMDSSANLITGGIDVSPNIHLSEGWNLVGHKGSNHKNAADSLSTINDKWSVLWNWNSGQWQAKFSMALALPDSIQQLLTLDRGKAYWIKIKPGQATNWTQ